jgi:hypothetical protein
MASWNSAPAAEVYREQTMSALSFITRTRPVAAVGDRSRTGDQSLSVVGYKRSPEQCFFLETYENPDQAAAIYSMNLTGQYAGRLIPCREPVNENTGPRPLLPAHLPELARTLRPLKLAGRDAFEISARVVRKTALVISADAPPVRKYTIKVSIRGRAHYITTYHRPNVSLERVYAIPNRDRAIAIVSFIGMPYELGDRVEHALLIDLN